MGGYRVGGYLAIPIMSPWCQPHSPAATIHTCICLGYRSSFSLQAISTQMAAWCQEWTRASERRRRGWNERENWTEKCQLSIGRMLMWTYIALSGLNHWKIKNRCCNDETGWYFTIDLNAICHKVNIVGFRTVCSCDYLHNVKFIMNNLG